MTKLPDVSRRSVLAGAVAMPAAALPASLSATAPEPDPALVAYENWKRLRAEEFPFWRDYGRLQWPNPNSPEAKAAFFAWRPYRDRVCAAEDAFVETVATTPQGLAAQLRFSVERYDRNPPFADEPSLSMEEILEGGYQMVDGKLYRSILAAVERLAAEAI